VENIFGVCIHYIIPASVLLGVLIFVHEFGHFIVAKIAGVRVLKFSLGFGPKIIGKKIGETEYLLSLLPLGGYVKPLGETFDESVADKDKPFSLSHQSKFKRFAVLVAGSLFNIIFASLIFTSVYMIGTPMLIPKVGQVIEDSPAKKANIKEGDVILSINGKDIELWEELANIIAKSKGESLTLQILRNDQTFITHVIPQITLATDIFGENIKTYKIGITSSGSKDCFIEKRYNPAVALWKSIKDTWRWTKLTIIGLGILIKSPVKRKDDIGGPILIGKLAGDFAQIGMLSFVLLMAMISVNLGVLNLLPIPILDGGHIFFLCIEAIKGSPISIKKMEIAQQIGLALLLLIMVFVFYNDITRFITG
jgi:regulator of sigma E protease